MRALLSRAPGGPETLEIGELPDPTVGAGQVVVAIKACAINYPDVLVIEEKGPVVERQIKELLYHLPGFQRPRVVGKTDEHGAPVLRAYRIRDEVIAEVPVEVAG